MLDSRAISQAATTPVRPTLNEPVTVVAAPQQARRLWSPRPEPAILSPAERGAARIMISQTATLGSKCDKPPRVRGRHALFWSPILLLMPMVFSAAFYVVKQTPKADTVAQSALPLPSRYGVYAISKGQLHELEPLRFRPPDPRVRVSAEITKPSTTVLPDGKIAFVVFRQELASGSQQKVAVHVGLQHKVTVRVVARVARKVTFEAKKSMSVDVQNSWRIRSDSYDFSVGPLGNNPEMVAVRPSLADFVLPAGRYALIFGTRAYDFTVEGPVTDRAHCLENVISSNGQIFTECRPKGDRG
jgi:hypothetical protein